MPNLLRTLRETHKISQKQIARAMHVNESTVSRWEKDEYPIPLAQVFALARYLRVRPIDIVPDLTRYPHEDQADTEHEPGVGVGPCEGTAQ